MSFQQQNSRDMEKPRLDCATPTDAKPFSIRNYVSMSRQKKVAQSWPFQQKYLKLFLDHGISNVLPPLETHNCTADGLYGRSIKDISLNKKGTHESGKNRGIGKHKTEMIPKHGEDGVSPYNTISHLCGKLAQLCLSSNGDTIVGHKKPLTATRNRLTSGNQSPYKLQNISNKNVGSKGVKRKGKTKIKSLAEILAVAKHCILDSHGRICESGGDSPTYQVRNAVVQREKKLKYMATCPEPKEDCSLIKKHQRRHDFVAGMLQFSKRSLTMGASNYRNQDDMKEISAVERQDCLLRNAIQKAETRALHATQLYAS